VLCSLRGCRPIPNVSGEYSASVFRVYNQMTTRRNNTEGHNVNVIFPISLYVCETWCLALRKEISILKLFENRILSKTGSKKEEVKRENGMMRSLITSTFRQILLGY
jgi:hypothetical protein